MAFFVLMSNNPIGIFDSGLGGLSVWRELIKILPNENIIYYADSANCPYGQKSKDEVIHLVQKIVNFLLQKNCKMIVVACNTATAAAIDYLRENYNIPFIGMEPAVKPASLNSKTKSIAVLATEGTFNGRLYLETSARFANDVKINIKVGDRLVDIVENGLINEDDTYKHLQGLIKPLVDLDIDHVVLGCTHYPFLIPVLKKILPRKVKIIDPAPAVAKQAYRVLEANQLLNNVKDKPRHEFYTSGDLSIIEQFLRKITKKENSIYKV